MYRCLYKYEYTCKYMHIYMCVYIYTHKYMYISTFVYIYTHIYIYTYKCTYRYIFKLNITLTFEKAYTWAKNVWHSVAVCCSVLKCYFWKCLYLADNLKSQFHSKWGGYD